MCCLLEMAIVGHPGEAQGVARLDRAVGRHHRELVVRRLRRGIGAVPAEIQEFDRGGGHRADEVVGAGEVDVELGSVALEAEIGVHALDLRWRKIAPAAVVDVLERDVGRSRSTAGAGLRGDLRAPERAGARIDLRALISEAVLHAEHDGAAERIEPEHGVAAHDRDIVDSVGGQEVPVDDVTEGLVDAHAVLVDSEPLRNAVER